MIDIIGILNVASPFAFSSGVTNTYFFTISVIDSVGNTGSQAYSLTITP